MFGIGAVLSNWKLILGGVLAVAVVSIIGVGYMHYQGLVEDNRRLSENNAKLETAVETQQGTIAAQRDAIGQWAEQAARLQASIEEMQAVQRQASQELRRINDIFADHDLTNLSRAKPGLIEPRINSGTADALRMLERVTAGGADDAGAGGEAADGPASP